MKNELEVMRGGAKIIKKIIMMTADKNPDGKYRLKWKIPVPRVMKLLVYSMLLTITPVVLALPPVFVNLSDSVRTGAYYDPDNNDSSLVGTNSQATSSTGVLPQTSGSVGDSISSVWTRADSVASPIGDGSSEPVTWNTNGSATASRFPPSIGALHAYCPDRPKEIAPFSVS